MFGTVVVVVVVGSGHLPCVLQTGRIYEAKPLVRYDGPLLCLAAAVPGPAPKPLTTTNRSVHVPNMSIAILGSPKKTSDRCW